MDQIPSFHTYNVPTHVHLNCPNGLQSLSTDEQYSSPAFVQPTGSDPKFHAISCNFRHSITQMHVGSNEENNCEKETPISNVKTSYLTRIFFQTTKYSCHQHMPITFILCLLTRVFCYTKSVIATVVWMDLQHVICGFVPKNEFRVDGGRSPNSIL